MGPRRYVIARLDAFRVLHFVWPAWDFLDMYHKSDTFCMVFHTLVGSRGGGGRRRLGVGWGHKRRATRSRVSRGGGGRGGVLGWGGVISSAPRNVKEKTLRILDADFCVPVPYHRKFLSCSRIIIALFGYKCWKVLLDPPWLVSTESGPGLIKEST